MNKDVCSACDSLKATSSNFIQKGVTDTICANLKANQGFENKGHNNCTDMHDMNDCLLGGLLEKIDTIDVCDTKEAIKDLEKNLISIMDVMICSDCGQWEEIEKLWAEIAKIWAAIKALQDRIENTEGNVDKISNALTKVLQNLKNSGAWNQTGDTIFDGSFNDNRNIATGNINIFGGTPDGSSYIRTNNGKTENDLAGGV